MLTILLIGMKCLMVDTSENGITVCKDECHMAVEQFHITQGDWWEEGLHPNDLYKLINSSKEFAIEKSLKL